ARQSLASPEGRGEGALVGGGLTLSCSFFGNFPKRKTVALIGNNIFQDFSQGMGDLPTDSALDFGCIRHAAAHILKARGIGFAVRNVADGRGAGAAGDDLGGKLVDGDFVAAADVVD